MGILLVVVVHFSSEFRGAAAECSDDHDTHSPPRAI